MGINDKVLDDRVLGVVITTGPWRLVDDQWRRPNITEGARFHLWLNGPKVEELA